jgi:hypothetical protein
VAVPLNSSTCPITAGFCRRSSVSRNGCKSASSTGTSTGQTSTLAGAGAEADLQSLGPLVPAHRQTSAAPIAERRPAERRGPLFGFEIGQAQQLLGEGALLELQLIGLAQMLQIATAAKVGMRTGGRAPPFARLEHALAARLDDLGMRPEHARLDPLAGQRSVDEPGAPVTETDAPTVVSESLDHQYLFLAQRNLRLALATCGLKAQTAAASCHQKILPSSGSDPAAPLPARPGQRSVGRVIDAGGKVAVAAIADDRDDHRVLQLLREA